MRYRYIIISPPENQYIMLFYIEKAQLWQTHGLGGGLHVFLNAVQRVFLNAADLCL